METVPELIQKEFNLPDRPWWRDNPDTEQRYSESYCRVDGLYYGLVTTVRYSSYHLITNATIDSLHRNKLEIFDTDRRYYLDIWLPIPFPGFCVGQVWAWVQRISGSVWASTVVSKMGDTYDWANKISPDRGAETHILISDPRFPGHRGLWSGKMP